MADVHYCVAGATIFCNKGTHLRRLDLPQSHGVYIRGRAATNEEDCEAMRNIPTFGVCLSESNPNGQAQTSHREGRLPLEGASETIIGRSCVPRTTQKWLNAKDDVLVGGKPALTVECTLGCSTGGGTIAFVDDGQGVG